MLLLQEINRFKSTNLCAKKKKKSQPEMNQSIHHFVQLSCSISIISLVFSFLLSLTFSFLFTWPAKSSSKVGLRLPCDSSRRAATRTLKRNRIDHLKLSTVSTFSPTTSRANPTSPSFTSTQFLTSRLKQNSKPQPIHSPSLCVWFTRSQKIKKKIQRNK